MKLEARIRRIEKRNRRVELDKAWETSWTRRIAITILTYLVIVLFFIMANVPRPYLSALVPAIGFLLSTLTLSALKKLWMRKAI